MRINYIVADKGYDSKSNRRYALQKKIYPHIPRRITSGTTYERLYKPFTLTINILELQEKQEEKNK